MNLIELFDQARDHYVEQFEVFVDAQNDACVRGHAEVKCEVSEQSGFHRRLWTADFIKNDNSVEAIAFAPERLLRFDKVIGTLGRMGVVVESFCWDNAVLHFNSATSPQLDSWFDRWFDPDDRRHDPAAKLGSVIHSLSVEPGLLSVDLGTAPAEALWHLLQELEQAGADQVLINNDAGRRH